MLNKYEARDDLVRKDVELKILLKTIYYLAGQKLTLPIPKL